ncbi:unannotated protein [freshwater metagenome]|uniref:Unannotated protein n=1 Tax=freshwater metagenome TaxID=449393 RepID=A0A6J6H9K9_9ZZZZ
MIDVVGSGTPSGVAVMTEARLLPNVFDPTTLTLYFTPFDKPAREQLAPEEEQVAVPGEEVTT